MDAYWHEDALFFYGDFVTALKSFVDFEHKSKVEELMASLNYLRDRDAFPDSRISNPEYENLVGCRFSNTITRGDIVSASSILDSYS